MVEVIEMVEIEVKDLDKDIADLEKKLNSMSVTTSVSFQRIVFSAICVMSGKNREQNTCKSDLNRIMTERPNICYIFEKLSVQGCQI